ncbi:MAG TPA: sulfite oxidase, partial [Acidimicrobiia bacterium]|nr:sulfite oxidase [Acidimicrobiia bacterium]
AKADLEVGPHPLAAAAWRHETAVAPGEHVVMARATDASGATQPLLSRWNRGGYANNVVHEVRFVAV